MHSAPFNIGQLVAVRAAPDRVGTILAVGAAGTYRVFHDRKTIVDYAGEQLVPLQGPAAKLAESSEGTTVAPDEFLARLTATRLASPLTDSIYALHAARIRFIPFQFKPLLRFLRSDRPRLLIADEVGVGKTIEAGLILRELQARQRVENVIIVCPKALVSKWRAEMHRFDEDFSILGPEALRYCLRETQLDGVWPARYSRVIVHLELLRIPEYLFGTTGRNPRPGLLSLDPPPRFSLAIFDEAHHVRNAASNSHAVAQAVCENADAALLLSATPVQLGSNNLYVLLNLLRPDLFSEPSAFRAMAKPTSHVNAAMRHVRNGGQSGDWQHRALNELTAARATEWGRHALARDTLFTDAQALLAQPTPLTDPDRIRLLRDLEELHPLARVINRTRRRDIGRFTLREPHTIAVPFTEPQAHFYTELLAFRSRWLASRHDENVVNLILDMLERQVASCLPALLPMLDRFLDTGSFSRRSLSDEDEDDFPVPDDLLDAAEDLRDLAAALPDQDPKAEALLSIVLGDAAGQPIAKTLVFSFFLHTLDHLHGLLAAAGVRVALICGRTPDDAWGYERHGTPSRSQLRERFRLPADNPEAIDVLLSSEVGCEGLDYEFCDRLVNYDIPWNPMRLEQRIGRIDRFGQKSPKVRIFNFITPGTVEERIFVRCFERLGVFRDTIGDCEDVLGELELRERLLAIAHDTKLSPRQADEAARQVADNILRLTEERERLGQDAQGLFGLDHALLEESQQLLTTERCVSPDALRQLIEWFLAQPHLRGELLPCTLPSSTFALNLGARGRAWLAADIAVTAPTDSASIEFVRWIEAGEAPLQLTFDASVALEHRSLAFVTPVHPLARAAIRNLAIDSGVLGTHVAVRSQTMPPGAYAVALELWESVGVAPELRFRTEAWCLDTGAPCTAIGPELMELVQRSTNISVSNRTDDLAVHDGLPERFEKHLNTRWRDEVASLRALNVQRLERKLAGVDAWHGASLSRVSAELASARDPRITRMKTAEKARIEREQAGARDQVLRRSDADILRRRLAIAVVEVQRDD